MAARYRETVPAGGERVVRLRLSAAEVTEAFGEAFDAVFDARRAEADTFHRTLAAPEASEDERLVQRQAIAGLLWSKQFYHYDVQRWLDGDPGEPPPPTERRAGRNRRSRSS